ncbi:probable cytochrome P450 6a13 [Colletes gigas]|uniref:probable cytochrome P450 6a13 n=1 Tax=Colletes gigas TaxID=935657 RepID=UPI001C9B2A4C|nr:probable cytochrome P450 6a13 [Colletes gigas]
MTWPAFESLGLLVAVLILFYYYATSNYDFWEKRGVKGPRPIPCLGNYKDVFLGRASLSDIFVKAYYDYKDESMVGIFGGRRPLLVLRDPNLMKDVLIKDFAVFANRSPCAAEVEPLSTHLFRLESEKWRPLRTRLSPIFSSGKLKEMFHLLLECSNHLVKYVDGLVGNGVEIVESHEIAAKYTTDVIGSCAFGIEMKALAAEDSEFRKIGRQIFETTWQSFLRDRLREYPLIFKLVGRFIVDHEVTEFLTNITIKTIEYRIKNNVQRNDFIDILVDLKQHPEKLGVDELTDHYLAAQAFVFFIAGFESSSVTISNSLFELSLNPTVQEKLRAEVKGVLQKNNGEITYESVREMKYLDACVKETLRKYPVVLYLARRSVTNYTFSGTKVTVPKDQLVYLPIYAIQRDPDIYPEPEVYDPDRFLDENAKHRNPMYFLPFGDGPRNCIASRFADYQTKVAVIRIMQYYKLDTCDKTPVPFVLSPKPLFLFKPVHGIYVKMSKLKE